MTAIRVLGRCGAEQKPESKSAPETKDLIRGATKRRAVPTFEIQNIRTVPKVRTPTFHYIFFQFEFGLYFKNKLLLASSIFSFEPS